MRKPASQRGFPQAWALSNLRSLQQGDQSLAQQDSPPAGQPQNQTSQFHRRNLGRHGREDNQEAPLGLLYKDHGAIRRASARRRHLPGTALTSPLGVETSPFIGAEAGHRHTTKGPQALLARLHFLSPAFKARIALACRALASLSTCFVKVIIPMAGLLAGSHGCC